MKCQSTVQVDTDYKEIVKKSTAVTIDGLAALKSTMALVPFAQPVVLVDIGVL